MCVLATAACGEASAGANAGADGSVAGSSSVSGGAGGSPSSAGSASLGGSGDGGGSGGSANVAGMGGGEMAEPPGPVVDRTDPKLYSFTFKPDQADPQASLALANQNAYLDTRVESRGKLVVFLHGAGEPSSCGGGALATLVAGWGFHWLGPCYVSSYGVGNCGDDIAGCRLEAFEGVDHHALIDIDVPNSIEGRVVAGLEYLQEQNPQGDWQYFIDGDKPRWSQIVVSGSSHGASSSGLIGMHRTLQRVVMLAGPLDTDQAWLEGTPMTPIERYFGFTHTGDEQHSGHLAAFAALGLPGTPSVVDGAEPPYASSHRLVSSRATGNGHNAVSDGNIEDYHPVFEYLFIHTH